MINTIDQLQEVIDEVKMTAYQAADRVHKEQYQGVDGGACGFAWVNIYSYGDSKIKGNTRIGKMMKAAGVKQDYTRAFQIWNPSSYPVQNIAVLEAGARAAAETFQKYGFTAYAGSRLD